MCLLIQVESGAQPRDSALPADITPVQPPNQQQDSNTVGLVVGLVIAGVVVGCLGALLVVLLRLRRKWPGGQLKQQAAVQQALVRHESTASSNGSGKQGCSQHTAWPQGNWPLSLQVLLLATCVWLWPVLLAVRLVAKCPCTCHTGS
jgi:H+/Cl- antiporter ClcA